MMREVKLYAHQVPINPGDTLVIQIADGQEVTLVKQSNGTYLQRLCIMFLHGLKPCGNEPCTCKDEPHEVR